MSLLDNAKMPSLKDKITAQAEQIAETVREKEEKNDEMEAKIIKKASKKK